MSELKVPKNQGVFGRQNNLHTFSVDLVDADGVRYQGKFTTKRLSIADVVTLGVRKSEINGGMYYDSSHPGKGVDYGTDELGAIIAHLEISLKAFPKWWNLNEITSTEVLNAVYREVSSFEESFLQQPGTTDSGSSKHVPTGEGDSGGNVQKSDIGGISGDVVDEEIQSALEP